MIKRKNDMSTPPSPHVLPCSPPGLSVVVTLLGAATAYFINANLLLRSTHFYLNPGWSDETAMYVNTLFYMILMYPLTCIK